MKQPLFLLACFVALPLAATAQENIAGGTLQQEASWNALRTLVGKADGKADVAQITANNALDKATKIEACGKQSMIYAPGVKGADKTTGCLAVSPVFSGCHERAGNYGVHVNCGANQVVTKVCSAGRDPDCIAPVGTLMVKGSVTRDGFRGPTKEYTLASPAQVFTVLTCCSLKP